MTHRDIIKLLIKTFEESGIKVWGGDENGHVKAIDGNFNVRSIPMRVVVDNFSRLMTEARKK